MAEVIEAQSPDNGEDPPQSALEEPPADVPPPVEEPEEPPKPAPQKKGKTRVEPEPQEEAPAPPPPSPPKLKRARTTKAPPASGQPAQAATPVPVEPIDVVAAVLTALREQQQVRANSRRDKCATWCS